MKKAIFTLGLFSMMMVLTSFSTKTKEVSPAQVISIDTGGQQMPKSKGLDYADANIFIPQAISKYDTKGGQQLPKDKKLD